MIADPVKLFFFRAISLISGYQTNRSGSICDLLNIRPAENPLKLQAAAMKFPPTIRTKFRLLLRKKHQKIAYPTNRGENFFLL